MDNILIIGSAPSAPLAATWDLAGFDAVVVINNAWRAVPDWTHFIHPEDFPDDRHPPLIPEGCVEVTADTYVEAQNAYGGFVYAGGTMAFTAAYWALAHFRPRTMSFFACDMVYPKSGSTHFYGTGTADPLRADPTLASLPAKARRLEFFAAEQGCALLNLSTDPSVLPYRRASAATISADHHPAEFDAQSAEAARDMEKQAGYYVPSGRYWENIAAFSPDILGQIDSLWLSAFPEASSKSASDWLAPN